MKVRMTITLGVDLESWAETYGIDADQATVRDDVRRWAANALGHHPDGLTEVSTIGP